MVAHTSPSMIDPQFRQQQLPQLALTHIASACISSCPFTFPQVLRNFERMILDPDCTSQLMASLIISDPMLTILTLSRANGSGTGDVIQLSQAVSVLGLSLVHGFCDECLPIDDSLIPSMAQHWSFSHACAAMTRILGPQTSFTSEEMNNPEILGCLGLVHNIGDILYTQYFNEYALQSHTSIRSIDRSFADITKELLGLRPSDIGALFAQAWLLPDIYVNAIRYHNRPRSCVLHPEIAALIHVSHSLTTACGYYSGDDQYVTPIQDSAMEILGIKDKHLHACVKQFFEENDDLSMFEGFLTRT